ncbi:TetR/AcrR family transcriptional regulator [Lysobacter sp. ISL-50]|uniref:TetR/AcrR family transcriptional regulator n=1 Tax=unclassified Lysobacter TaxID=2635362 RepID=UPI001BE9B0C9|nr:TetR/AcrR family transcriptional regulator [Lysobacter sp. ISL-42]MBT2752058.1 TetR/AcrR family transcriptional regulator [Lysobacter sp. ISL-50]MBT2778555.1 TetR/AcrR family transcriptional regulator [Lysobacter sp. ISL-54]MBT2780514.1 TetR/AcrR family transcriptional regulator [Lysobacter sp. ISL-52]
MTRPPRNKDLPVERYHHGDLRIALIQAADRILAEQGLEGFSLREAARRAGVSAAAPAHHFGGASGLLSEVAVLGFDELARHLQTDASAGTPTQRLRMQGIGYVRFALTYPGRFQLMFRRDLLSPDHAGLQDAGDRAMAQLEQTIRAMHAIAPDQPMEARSRVVLLASWSMVHGFAHLALDGKLAHMHAGATSDDLLTRVLPQMLQSQWPDPA